MKFERRWWIVGGAVVVLAVTVMTLVNRKPNVDYVTAAVERGDIHDAVEATGSVNAVTTVQVGSQVSGTIARLNADFNSSVHRGEVIALIDPALFRGTLQQAIADSQNALANVIASRANLEKAKATLAQAAADYDRSQKLAKDNLIPQQQLEISKAAYDGAAASVNGAEANVVQARAQLNQKAAAVAVARTDLGYTVIRSPSTGSSSRGTSTWDRRWPRRCKHRRSSPSPKTCRRCSSTPRSTNPTSGGSRWAVR
jgi:HlyD family secretion protein